MPPFLFLALLTVPITAFVVIGAVFLARSPIGSAVADRLRGGSADTELLRRQLDQLHCELEAVRQELAETQDRVEFAERLLRPADPARAGSAPARGQFGE
jgi:hypothetical protein